MTAGALFRRVGRPMAIILAGVAAFLLLSIFSSDPSPDAGPNGGPPAEQNCSNNWRKCSSDAELLKNWRFELGHSPARPSPGLSPQAETGEAARDQRLQPR
jgi:hypothetical protein